MLSRPSPFPRLHVSSFLRRPAISASQWRYQSTSPDTQVQSPPPRCSPAVQGGVSPLGPPEGQNLSGTVTRQSGRRVPRPPVFPQPILASNPYAGSYAISEDELGQSFDGLNLSEDTEPSTAGPLASFKLSPVDEVSVYSYFFTLTSSGKTGVVTFSRLRDSCTCGKCQDSSTRQLNTTTGMAVKEAEGTQISLGKPQNDHILSPRGLLVKWSGGSHSCHFSISRLRSMISIDAAPWTHRAPFFRRTWNASAISQTNMRFSYDDLDQSLLPLLEQLHMYGLVVIANVPTDPTNNERCKLREVVGRIGEIRNTFYGETWDVKSMKQSKNVAYTNLDLGLHMDLLYFASPPRFQALHCLRNKVEGGMSYFVDSFKVAEDLPRPLFRALQQTYIPYRYDNDNHYLSHSHPVISQDFDLANLHSAVNWSPPFRGPKMALSPAVKQASIASLSLAARQEQQMFNDIAEFEERLGRPEYRHSFMMEEGDLVIFDNRRVLHARTAFNDRLGEEGQPHDGQAVNEASELRNREPTRWLKGCYLDGEVIWDKLSILSKHAKREARS